MKAEEVMPVVEGSNHCRTAHFQKVSAGHPNVHDAAHTERSQRW